MEVLKLWFEGLLLFSALLSGTSYAASLAGGEGDDAFNIPCIVSLLLTLLYVSRNLPGP